MSLGQHLLLRLGKKYEPSATLSMKYKGYDVLFKTDAEGNPVTLFIGREKEDGRIKGERYSRVLKHDQQGRIIRDHWDLKGKT